MNLYETNPGTMPCYRKRLFYLLEYESRHANATSSESIASLLWWPDLEDIVKTAPPAGTETDTTKDS